MAGRCSGCEKCFVHLAVALACASLVDVGVVDVGRCPQQAAVTVVMVVVDGVVALVMPPLRSE